MTLAPLGAYERSKEGVVNGAPLYHGWSQYDDTRLYLYRAIEPKSTDNGIITATVTSNDQATPKEGELAGASASSDGGTSEPATTDSKTTDNGSTDTTEGAHDHNQDRYR